MDLVRIGNDFIRLALDQNQNDAPLQVGRVNEREIKAGEKQSYRILLKSGEYLHIVVQSQQSDLVLTIIRPDEQIAAIVEISKSANPQDIPLVTEIEGSYLLEVHLAGKEVVARRYALTIAELRQATGEDRKVASLQSQLREAKKLDDEFGKLYGNRQYDDALSVAQHSLDMREKLLRPDDSLIAVSLNQLALAYYAKSEFNRAEPLAKRAVQINEGLTNADPTALASALNTQALIHHAQGQFAEAETLYLRVLSLTEKSLGPFDLEVAQTLDLLSLLYTQEGNYAKAAQLYMRSLEIREKAFGSNSPEIVETLNNLAERYRLLGRFDDAESLYQRALTIVEKAFGNDDPRVATVLSSFGSFYYMKGIFPKADRYFQRALDIREKKLSSDDPLLAESINDLTYLRIQMGNYVDAEKNYLRALEIVRKAYGQEHQIVATAIGNLAELYRATGEWDKAELLYKQSLAMREKVLGADHPQVAESLNNFANFYQRNGKYAQAEPLQRRALEIDEKRLGPQHPDVAMDLNNLALIYFLEGQYAKAEPLSRRSLAIREKIFSPEHPSIAESLISTSMLYSAMGDVKQALLFLRRGLEVREKAIDLTMSIGSGQQKVLFMDSLSHEVDGVITFQIQSAHDSLEARLLALDTILGRKGRALDAMAGDINTLRRHLKPEARDLFERLDGFKSRLGTLVFEKYGEDNPAAYQDEVNKLKNEVERLESQLSSQSDEYRRVSQPITVRSVQAVTPANAVLVEFVSYQLFDAAAKTDKERFGAPRYAAYVMRHDGDPAFVDLDEAGPINQDVREFRAALRNPKESIRVRQIARALDQRVMRPVRKLIGSKRIVLLSPDGQLNLIPFAALVDEEGKYLIEHYTFSYLTSGRDLLRMQTHLSNEGPPAVIANPLFARQLNSSMPVTGKPYFGPLNGTAREGEEVGRLLHVKPLMGAAATEAKVKQLKGPRILHLATHGFFLPNPDQATTQSSGSDRSQDPSLALALQAGDNPLLRSGLALSGANQLDGGDGENGILTALEASGLDLMGTELVVLSACETGLGEILNGEGVYGLRRSLTLAGAESQVMSLWKVNDEVTRDLMVAYHKRLKRGEGRSEALRQEQLQLLKTKQSHPYFWAAFIESGDWKRLSSK